MKPFWKIFASCGEENNENQSGIYQKLKNVFPQAEEDHLIMMACLAGLFARIAYVDFQIAQEEIDLMHQVLGEWTHLDQGQIRAIVDLAVNEVKELGGIENHMYVHHLKPYIDLEQRYQLLVSLFALAASDGSVDNYESEDIKIIAKGLDLSDQHFLSARATVIKKLAALRK